MNNETPNNPMPTLNLTAEQIEVIKSWEVSYDKKEEAETFLFSWCGKKFIQLHKLNGITAIGASKVAAGKSMLCNLFMAASLCGRIHDLREPSHVLECLVRQCTSLYVDAEMGRASTQTALVRIRMTCAAYGYDTPYRYKQRTKAISIDTMAEDSTLAGIQYYISTYRPDVVYIDNMVFLLNNMDVNDPTSAKRIAEIDSWCKKYNTTIILVAHGNKAAEDVNIAGTAGTMMMRLTSYILAIQEGDGEVSGKFKKVVTQKARQGGFDGVPDFTFHFIPFVYKDIESVYPVVGQPFEEPKQENVSLFQDMFADAEVMSYTAVRDYIIEHRNVNGRQARNIIRDAVFNGIIAKVGMGKRDPYQLLIKGKKGNERTKKGNCPF